MVPELKETTYEESLRKMQLMTQEERREKGDLITIYKLVNLKEKVDNEDLLLTREGESQLIRGHNKKLRKDRPSILLSIPLCALLSFLSDSLVRRQVSDPYVRTGRVQ